jgi:hypothetical protein
MKKKLLIVMTILVLLVLFYSITEFRMNKIIKKINKEYAPFSLETKLNGRISGIDNGDPKIFRNDPDEADITINDSIKRRITTSREISSKQYFDDVIRVGDSISKISGSDKITFFRIQVNDTMEFNFSLKDDQHYPLKK